MFTNVLVGIDGRGGGRDAAMFASRLASEDATLTLAHVRGQQGLSPYGVAPAETGEDREASQRLLERERDGAGLAAEILSVEAMSPGRGLHEIAEEREVDLLVVGSCSRGVLGRAMLGDDTRESLNGAPCAVAIAAVGYADHPLALANIGVGYDESPESEIALQTARQLALPTHATVHALQVISIQTYAYTGLTPPALGENIDRALKEANARLQGLPEVRGRAVSGLTGEELAHFGEEVDLLVVGSRGYGPLKRLVVGSTSNYLQRHARCALLVLPRGTHASAGTIDAESP